MWLLIDFVIYMSAAMYFNQVIPQDYGVPKHPLFLFDKFIARHSKKLHFAIFGDDSILEVYKDQ